MQSITNRKALMRLHTNHHTPDTIRFALLRAGLVNEGVFLRSELTDVYGSRSHARAYEIRLGSDGGADRDGARRRHNMDGAPGHGATHAEWGRFIAELYDDEPGAKIGPYARVGEFNRRTDSKFKPARTWSPAREARECSSRCVDTCAITGRRECGRAAA